ncbi:MAG: gamma-glutamyltransferase, partial [Chloroflexota bacterium]
MTQTRPTVYARESMIATPHYLASEVGLSVLRDGGNAVDAAIAANAVLNVVAPNQCHMGGDLFALVWDPARSQLAGLNASGAAPKGASIEDVRRQGHDSMPERGALSVTVPGTVGGWMALHERYGSWEFDRIVEPAAKYAESGVPITANFAAAHNAHRWLLARDPVASTVFLGDRDLKPGQILQQPNFARTLRAVGRRGADAFYRGDIAEDIVAALRSGGSAMTLEDLDSFSPEWVEPLRVGYRGVELVELPPNSQGPAALLLAGIAEGWDVNKDDQGSGEVLLNGVEA